jgi:hypothetical protein
MLALAHARQGGAAVPASSVLVAAVPVGVLEPPPPSIVLLLLLLLLLPPTSQRAPPMSLLPTRSRQYCYPCGPAARSQMAEFLGGRQQQS